MTDSEFELLASRILAGEASAEDRHALDRALANPQRLRQFDELRIAWTSLHETAPLLDAIETVPEPMPAHTLTQLLEEVRARHQPPAPILSLPAFAWARSLLGNKVALATLAAVLAVAAYYAFNLRPFATPPAPIGYFIVTHGVPSVLRDGTPMSSAPHRVLWPGDELRLEANAAGWLLTVDGLSQLNGPRTVALTDGEIAAELTPVQLALFSPPSKLLADPLLTTTRGADGISVYSPRSTTARLMPAILWRAESNATYDLALRDELNPDTPPWQLNGVRPPVQFANLPAWRDRPLQPDGVYRLTIQQSGQPLSATEITFATTPALEPPPTADPSLASSFTAAYEDLTAAPPRTGDALATLLSLPEPHANSELALRLRLLAFGALGLTDEFQTTLAQIRLLH
ncbi:MAG: hypothetical protein KJ072_27280 [Verrucomicrobia bacterium]|nr:hypothetical protein [Verrucomicrobiota bacterium]